MILPNSNTSNIMESTDLIVAYFKKRTDNSVCEFCLVLSFETPFLWLWTQALSVGNKRRDTSFACVNVMPKIPFPVGSYPEKYGRVYRTPQKKFYSDKPFFQIPFPCFFSPSWKEGDNGICSPHFISWVAIRKNRPSKKK